MPLSVLRVACPSPDERSGVIRGSHTEAPAWNLRSIRSAFAFDERRKSSAQAR
jgi:hypothetical protein